MTASREQFAVWSRIRHPERYCRVQAGERAQLTRACGLVQRQRSPPIRRTRAVQMSVAHPDPETTRPAKIGSFRGFIQARGWQPVAPSCRATNPAATAVNALSEDDGRRT